MSFQRVLSLVAWKIDALASASASLAAATPVSKSPLSAAFLAAVSVAAVVVHWLRKLPASLLAASAAAKAALKSASDAAKAPVEPAISSIEANADFIMLMAALPGRKSAAHC